MKCYSYRVEHDLGLAPNPFGTYCTLSVCKPQIRKSSKLSIGDWVIGTGSQALSEVAKRDLANRLIYAMKVSEIIPMDSYWGDSRFRYKRPILNGSMELMYGDNIYGKDNQGNWFQLDSAHSLSSGKPNLKHQDTDLGGKNTLISESFYYFGDSAPEIPSSLLSICIEGIGQKLLNQDEQDRFLDWLTNNFNQGKNGRPVSWIKYDSTLF